MKELSELVRILLENSRRDALARNGIVTTGDLLDGRVVLALQSMGSQIHHINKATNTHLVVGDDDHHDGGLEANNLGDLK